MARIAFFTESLPPAGGAIAAFAWDLIRSAADQQHEIRVFSTYHEKVGIPENHPRIEVLRPFRRWSIRELPRLIPLLLHFRPEILHMIQPHREALEGFTNAMDFLPGLASLIGSPPTVTSFFDVNEKELRRHRFLLSTASALTVSNAHQARTVRGFYRRRQPPPIEIIPAGLGHAHNQARQPEMFGPPFHSAESPPEALLETALMSGQAAGSLTVEAELIQLMQRHPAMICIPGPIDQHLDPAFTFAVIAAVLREHPQACAVVTGGWGNTPVRVRRASHERLEHGGVGERVIFTGPITDPLYSRLLHTATCVIIATLDDSRLAFTEVLRACQRAASVLVLSHAQAELDPIGWRSGENSLICAARTDILSDAVGSLLEQANLRGHLQRNICELTRAGVIDTAGNRTSRLYARLLT